MRIAHFGTFDVANYGDLLFPLVIERRLRNLNAEFVHISPAGGPPVWTDCRASISVEAIQNSGQQFTGVALGGGQLVHAAPTFLPEYFTDGFSAFTAYPALWLGSAHLAAQNGAPLIWNAPGVPVTFSPVAAEFLRWAGSVARYLSVRDNASREHLVSAGIEGDIETITDSASEVATLWSEEQVKTAYRDAFLARGQSAPSRSIAFHFRSWYSDTSIAETAALLDAMCVRHTATPILIAIGPCHGDSENTVDISRAMKTGPLVIDKPQSLIEIAACIACSDAYIGSSLHGAITACSFGTKAMLVAPSKVRKFGGFLDRTGLDGWKAASWPEAAQRFPELLAADIGLWRSVRSRLRAELDQHWTRIIEVLKSGADHSTLTRSTHLSKLDTLLEKHCSRTHLYQGIVAESLHKTLIPHAHAANSQSKRAEIRELKKSRDKYKKRLQELEASFSWKITKPLRAVHRTFNRKTSQLKDQL